MTYMNQSLILLKFYTKIFFGFSWKWGRAHTYKERINGITIQFDCTRYDIIAMDFGM